MVRLNFIVEGHSEESFVNQVLVPHLASFAVFARVRRAETSRSGARIYRGGVLRWNRAARDIRLWAREDNNPDARFTTMFDLYRLPRDAPGTAASKGDPWKRVYAIEAAMSRQFDDPRVLPYVQLHEFETLLFADILRLRDFFPHRLKEVDDLALSVKKFGSPEEIDEGAETAPSRRVIAAMPEYAGQKPVAGPETLRRIGLATVRSCCPHFSAWLGCLESLAHARPLAWPVPVSRQEQNTTAG